jgi:RNA polymerase sigma-70 factor, ECF subfamily
MADVQQLVVRARAGDREAFALLYDQFAPLIRSMSYDATGSSHDMEDVCQEVFLQAYRKLDRLRDPSRFAGWLVVIARRTCSSWLRARRGKPDAGLDRIEPFVAVTGSDGVPDACNDEILAVLNAIRYLPPKERMALHLFYLAEQPAVAACETMGLSNSGFYRVLDRAKKRLAAWLQKREASR